MLPILYKIRQKNFHDQALTVLATVQLYLGGLLLIKALDFTYIVKVDGITYEKIFYNSFPFNTVLAAIFLVWMLWAQTKYPITIFSSVLYLTLYLFLGVESATSLISILCSVTTLAITRKYGTYTRSLFLGFLFLEALVLPHWIIEQPITGTQIIRDLALFELDLYYLLVFLAPPLFMMMLFAWVIIPLLNIARGKQWDQVPQTRIRQNQLTPLIIVLLAAVIFLGLITAIYPYTPGINPNGIDVGVDIRRYTRDVRTVAKNLTEAFQIQNGSRPLIFLSVYAYQTTLGIDSLTAVRFYPVLLLPLLYLSTFILSQELFNDPELSLWASFLTATGYQITVSLYAHFITNLQALILLFLSLTLLIRTLRDYNRINLITSLFLFLLVDFTHPWTYLQYLGSLGLALGYYFTRNPFIIRDKKFRTLTIFILSGLIIDVGKRLIVGGAGSEFAVSMAVDRFAELPSFWVHSLISSQTYYGGLLSNIPLIILAIIGLRNIDFNKLEDSIPFFLIAASSPLYIIGNQSLKSRLLLNQPIGIIAAIGLVTILRDKRLIHYKREIIIFIVFYSTVYLFRSIANIK